MLVRFCLNVTNCIVQLAVAFNTFFQSFVFSKMKAYDVFQKA